MSIALSDTANVIGTGKAIGFSNGSVTAGLSTQSGYLAALTGAYDQAVSSASFGTSGVAGIWGLTTDGTKSGLKADMSTVSAISINALRTAFAIQKLYEKDARGGTRYIEIIKAHFGVTSPDSRQQRPEYLGGDRLPININQVVQMSSNAGSDLLVFRLLKKVEMCLLLFLVQRM